jgi:isopenicillin-N N-acyltransferase like protein
MLKRLLKILAWLFGCMIVLLIIVVIYIRIVSKTDPPKVESIGKINRTVVQIDSGLFAVGNNWFRKSESGLYEMYVEGNAIQRGVAAGALAQDLVQYQEVVFNKQIEQIVPSAFYRKVLLYMIGWFNRNIDDYVPEEYKVEIYGISQSASHDFDYIAPAYQRLLNYHAAHDIGHALQNMSLVGCTSFATWGNNSQDSSLIIGRNFDFYVGEEFARNKIVAFYNPEHGYKFMMITFGGMVGVLSGMNEAGLTVTINAAKSEIPSGSATPVSLVAREILQYASTIDEAYEIARKRKMFVAESFLIGSAKDGRASIIEKNTEDIDIYVGTNNRIVCTNHFQSEKLGNTPLNIEHLRASASDYRYQRVTELLNEEKNSVARSAAILRNQRGLHDSNIGMGNEKSVNQLIAHHGIIFQPEKQLVWVSTPPWQLGKFVCYDLNKIFKLHPVENNEVYENDLTIPADSFLLTREYQHMVKLNAYRFSFSTKEGADPDSLVSWNKDSYLAYMLAGDHYYHNGDFKNAISAYESALRKEIATDAEKKHIEEYLEKSKSNLP